MFDLSYSASQMKINAINSLEVTCSVFHSVAISTKLLEINYSIPGYDQSSTLLKVSCQDVMTRQIESLSFSFVSLLTLPCAVVVVVV